MRCRGAAGFAINPAPSRVGSYLGWRPRVFCLRATRGDMLFECFEIAGGVLVAIQNEPAALATEGPVGQGQLGFRRPARRTDLRRRVEGGRLDQDSAAPGHFVGKLATDLGESRVMQGASETNVSRAAKAAGVQTLDHDERKLAGEPTGELVDRVATDVGGSRVQLAHSPLRFFHPPRVVDAPRSTYRPTALVEAARIVVSALAVKPALLAAQPPLCLLERARVRDPLTRGQHRQMAHTNINSDRPPGSIGRPIVPFDFARQRAIPASALPGYGHRQDPRPARIDFLEQLRCRLVRADMPDPRQSQARAVRHPESAGRVPKTLSCAAAAFEPREPYLRASSASLLGLPERLQPIGQVGQPRRRRLLGILCPPRGQVLVAPVPLASKRRQRPRHLHLPTRGANIQPLLDQSEPEVVSEPGGARMRGEPTLLPRCRSQREPVSLKYPHEHMFANSPDGTEPGDARWRWLAHRDPAVVSANQRGHC